MLRKSIAFFLVAVIFWVTAPKHGLHELIGHVETQHAHHSHDEDSEEHSHSDYTLESKHNHCDCYDFDAPLLVKGNYYIPIPITSYGKSLAVAAQNLVHDNGILSINLRGPPPTAIL